MIFQNHAAGALCAAGAFLTFVYYRQMSIRQFGGITGDTAGFFVVLSETVIMVIAAVCSVIWRMI